MMGEKERGRERERGGGGKGGLPRMRGLPGSGRWCRGEPGPGRQGGETAFIPKGESGARLSVGGMAGHLRVRFGGARKRWWLHAEGIDGDWRRAHKTSVTLSCACLKRTNSCSSSSPPEKCTESAPECAGTLCAGQSGSNHVVPPSLGGRLSSPCHHLSGEDAGHKVFPFFFFPV